MACCTPRTTAIVAAITLSTRDTWGQRGIRSATRSFGGDLDSLSACVAHEGCVGGVPDSASQSCGGAGGGVDGASVTAVSLGVSSTLGSPARALS
eukprot:810059-Pleurochrysis_carterae.AAC.1